MQITQTVTINDYLLLLLFFLIYKTCDNLILYIGVYEQRKAVSGSELPNVRTIRKTIFKDMDRPAPKYNLFLMQFGQMVAHDTELLVRKTQSKCL